MGFDRDALVRDGNIPAERIARFALLDVDGSGALRRIVEKPTDADAVRLGDSAPVSMNSWLFTAEIFAACRAVPLSARGELELPQAVQWAIERQGARFTVVPSSAPVLDLSGRDDIASVAERLAGREVRL